MFRYSHENAKLEVQEYSFIISIFDAKKVQQFLTKFWYCNIFRALFPCGDNLVCIIDDREDVWNRAANLIQVKPYHFFEHTGDINAPPGLEKTERDIEGQGVHLEGV